MNPGKTIFLISVWMLAFAILYFFLNQLLLYPLLVPHECYFQDHAIPPLTDLFFDFPVYNGFHPAPTIWGYVIAILWGGFIGWKTISLKANGN